MPDMGRERLADIDEITERLLEKGLIRGTLRLSFMPITGVNHKQRREFGLE